jgi:hypothetical protein
MGKATAQVAFSTVDPEIRRRCEESRVYWRVLFMACAERFGYRGGNERGIGDYSFSRRDG